MPIGGARRILWAVGIAGVVTFCSGCGFFMNNQLQIARLLFIAANVLIIPLFIYLVVLRSRASAQYKRRLKKQEAQDEKELADPVDVDELLKSNDIES